MHILRVANKMSLRRVTEGSLTALVQVMVWLRISAKLFPEPVRNKIFHPICIHQAAIRQILYRDESISPCNGNKVNTSYERIVYESGRGLETMTSESQRHLSPHIQRVSNGENVSMSWRHHGGSTTFAHRPSTQDVKGCNAEPFPHTLFISRDIKPLWQALVHTSQGRRAMLAIIVAYAALNAGMTCLILCITTATWRCRKNFSFESGAAIAWKTCDSVRQDPVLLLRSDDVASRLANGSAAFIWKLHCHWLRG